MKILVTGGAGFIGSALTKQLIDRGDEVVIVDNFNDYYEPQLKRDRISILLKGYAPTVVEADIRDEAAMAELFATEQFDKVVHLAAMAGVRNSLKNPLLYEEVNVRGTMILLDQAVKHSIQNFVYASSSSVYGNNTKVPFAESDPVDTPISPYAATKKCCELIAHTYSHIYQLPTTGLRFFTVYGPWGRPDMALFGFTQKILAGEPIEVYNYGNMTRNFTYVDDIVSGIITTLDANLPYAVMNIGGDREEPLTRFIDVIEENLGKKAERKLMPIQPGDVPSTVADITKLRAMGWEPYTRIDEGIANFVAWYREYYKVL
jgi:UDP-glucuronate 4-epimerase